MMSLYVCSCNKTKNSRKSKVFHTSRLYDVNNPECIQSEQTFAAGVSLDTPRIVSLNPTLSKSARQHARHDWSITHVQIFSSADSAPFITLFLSYHHVVPAPLSLPSTQTAIVKPALSSLTHPQWLSTYSLPYPQSQAASTGRSTSWPTPVCSNFVVVNCRSGRRNGAVVVKSGCA